jgi:type IV secretion system protein VirB9
MKKNLPIIALILITNLSSNIALGSQMPRFLGTEKKFRSFLYNPNEVYRYIGHYTYQGFIEFEQGETIGTISMGNPSLWLFESLGNRLFLKPVGEDGSETNMTVITSKKVYHFELMAREAKGIADKNLIFVVKFVYPDEKEKNIVEFSKTNLSDEPDLRDLSKYNFNYQYTGEKSIAPSKVFDNGQFTYFQFSNKNSEIPAIFNVDADGFESLVNYRVSADYVIVERVGAQFTLRNGSEIVCVYNINLYSSGREKSSLKNNNERNNELKNFSPALVPNQPFQSLSPNTSNNTIIPSANQSNSSPMPNMPDMQNMKMPGTFY